MQGLDSSMTPSVGEKHSNVAMPEDSNLSEKQGKPYSKLRQKQQRKLHNRSGFGVAGFRAETKKKRPGPRLRNALKAEAAAKSQEVAKGNDNLVPSILTPSSIQNGNVIEVRHVQHSHQGKLQELDQGESSEHHSTKTDGQRKKVTSIESDVFEIKSKNRKRKKRQKVQTQTAQWNSSLPSGMRYFAGHSSQCGLLRNKTCRWIHAMLPAYNDYQHI